MRTLLSRLLRLCGIGVFAADFDDPSWSGVELLPLQRPGALRRRAHVDRWSRGRCLLALCVAAATRQAATILAIDDVEVAWFLRLQATRPRQPLTARSD